MPKIDKAVFDERMRSYQNALSRFGEALAMPRDVGKIYLDASAHRFVYCYELTWKSLRRLLRMRDVKVNSPVMTFREAFHEGWILDKSTFERMIEDRNLVTHEYFEEKAIEIYTRLPEYLSVMKKLCASMQTIYDQEPEGL
jgi:nucleotidyltransferase substrate binding protein (TIGR01987 family)